MNWTSAQIIERIDAHILKKYHKNKSFPDFYTRLRENFDELYQQLSSLYGDNPQFLYHLEDIIESLCQLSITEPDQDSPFQSEAWFEQNNQIGMTFYIELFSGNIKKLEEKIDYLKELGVTYIHLMPPFKCPEKENDGGYAVSSFREIRKDLGSMKDLRHLSALLKKEGIRLVLDFILNHTANDHIWAQQAKLGDREFQDYYFFFDKEEAEAYGTSLRDIFPQHRKGSFTWNEENHKWVWTTFNSFQWDLNYQNPRVFKAMTEEMLNLANNGADVIRLDALAFIWKEKGSLCENLPKTHTLIRAFRACAAIGAPGLVFKSEAIVHPDDVIKYISPTQCELSYNPLLMATLWEALATRETRLLYKSLENRLALPDHCTWVNYIRCHDDIGWTFADTDAESLGIDPYSHRHFLNSFYTGRFPGSFAKGLPFQENHATGDARITGTTASLAGLEKALTQETEKEVDLAVKRLLLLYGVTLSMPGIPLINQGDELGSLNNYHYTEVKAQRDDSRWVHRLAMDWELAKLRKKKDSLENRIFSQLKDLIFIRKNNGAFGNGKTRFVYTEIPSLFIFLRSHKKDEVLVISNFSEKTVSLSENSLRIQFPGSHFKDLITSLSFTKEVKIKPYQLLWLIKEK